MPAPSARMKPSRSRSNGRLARVGSSLRVESARIEANPPRPMWVIAASLPPLTITSAQPAWISFRAVADRVGRRGAGRRHRRARALESPLDRDLPAGGVDHQLGDGERADPRGALLHHDRVLGLELTEAADPRADHHAALLGRQLVSKSIPESATAEVAAARANCANRSRCRASFTPNRATGSQSRTWPPNFTLNSVVSNSVSGPTPLWPAHSADQNRSRLSPSDVTTPIPVMTTRRGCPMLISI